MTFTYNLDNPGDLERVRYHIGDVHEDGAIFTDAEINFVLSETGNVHRSVISLLVNIVAQMSADPDFQADWLRVEYGRSLEGYKLLLKEKRREFGISAVSSAGLPVFRGDSSATGPPERWS
jgi:hypothetical protein